MKALFLALSWLVVANLASGVDAPRVKLYRFDDFVAADFNQGVVPPTRTYNPQTRELEFRVELLIANASREKSQPLLIRGAQFQAEKETFGAECRDPHRSVENLTLKPGDHVRLDCIVRLVATEKNGLGVNGSRGFVKIPYDGVAVQRALRIPIEVSASEFKR